MKWLAIILGGLIVLVALVWIAGASLPREHRAASQITLRQPIDSVWAVVRDPMALKGVWRELTSVSKQTDAQGREVWQEKVDGFDIRLIVAESEPPERLVMNVDSPPAASFGGRWVYELSPAAGGTTVQVAEEGWIGPPPLRLMSRLMGYHRSVDGYLSALARKFGEAEVPEHLP
jgi:uncharacterized protein YndB with AHSA1/START domain